MNRKQILVSRRVKILLVTCPIGCTDSETRSCRIGIVRHAVSDDILSCTGAQLIEFYKACDMRITLTVTHVYRNSCYTRYLYFYLYRFRDITTFARDCLWPWKVRKCSVRLLILQTRRAVSHSLVDTSCCTVFCE